MPWDVVTIYYSFGIINLYLYLYFHFRFYVHIYPYIYTSKIVKSFLRSIIRPLVVRD